MPYRPPKIIAPQVILPTAENGFQTDVTEARLDVGDTGEIPKVKATKPQPIASAAAPSASEELGTSSNVADLGTDAQLHRLNLGTDAQLQRLRRTTVDTSIGGNFRRLMRNVTRPRY